jgi:hypothetical protein
MLERGGLLAPGADPNLDRWTAALRRATGAHQATLSLLGTHGPFVKSQSLLAARCGGAAQSHMELPIVVDGELLGRISVADPCAREWTVDERSCLEDAAAAVATEVRLRLAKYDAARAHELVATHGKVHELIAAGAPLCEVLVELVEGIERHDPSVIPCVVLLDRESHTLHPGAGPALPPHYLAATDGVVIGPNVGTCGSAAWSGTLTITPDVATDPKWAPIRIRS